MDRAALDVAKANQIPYGGWCPQGGLAEDFPLAPGLHQDYPTLQNTPSADYLQRTEWNVRDAHATLVIAPNWVLANTGGTNLTIKCAAKHRKHCFVAYLNQTQDPKRVCHWLVNLPTDELVLNAAFILNVAGPRASKVPQIYEESALFLQQMLTALQA